MDQNVLKKLSANHFLLYGHFWRLQNMVALTTHNKLKNQQKVT